MRTALRQVPGYKPSCAMCHGFWQFRWDHLLSHSFSVTKRLQAKLQYPSCSATAALQGHPRNHFAYGDHSILLKDKIASSIDPFYPPAHPLPVPVVSGSGYPSMEIQRWGGKRRTIDVSGSKGNMQVERIDLTSKLVTWGETMVFLPRSLKLLCLMKESKEKPPIGFLNTILPAWGKLPPNFGNRLSVRLDF